MRHAGSPPTLFYLGVLCDARVVPLEAIHGFADPQFSREIARTNKAAIWRKEKRNRILASELIF